jgi:hypothetical protein
MVRRGKSSHIFKNKKGSFQLGQAEELPFLGLKLT